MSKYKLLLADDSITIQKVVNLTFADKGIDVTTVSDGDTALEKIAEIRPDIVLADVNMPGLNGYKLCELIRKDVVTKDLPFILLVGSFEPFNVDEADRVGANAFLSKPFNSIPELVAQVNDLLESPAWEESNATDLEMPQTEDIDALYQQSFVETTEVGGNGKVNSEFTDAGMDDEIIETTYVDSLQELPPDKLNNEELGATHSASESSVSKEMAQSINDDLARLETLSSDTIPKESVVSPARPLEEPDLLELPAAADEKTFEIDIPESASKKEGNSQIVSLSPELIETIVQKVVEKLAKKY